MCGMLKGQSAQSDGAEQIGQRMIHKPRQGVDLSRWTQSGTQQRWKLRKYYRGRLLQIPAKTRCLSSKGNISIEIGEIPRYFIVDSVKPGKLTIGAVIAAEGGPCVGDYRELL